MLEIYAELVQAGAPEVGPVDWWRQRLQVAAEEAWDESLSRRTPEELGFVPAPQTESDA